MRFEELLDRHERGHLTQGEAGEMLGVSERTFRRWQVRYREEGAAGLRDRRVGKPSPRRADEGELARAKALYAEMYDGFTVKHFHEQLQARHGYRLGYTVTRLALQASGLVRQGAAARGAPAQAAAAAAAGHAAASGRGAPRLAGGPAVARPGGHPRRRDERGLLGDPGRGGGHRLELPGAGRGDRRQRACSVRSTPTAAATTSTRPWPAAASTGSTRPRSAGRWRSSASSISPPIRRRRAAARSAPSAPSRTGCRRSWRWPGSPTSTPPTPGCARSTCPRTTPASRCRRRSRAPPSSPSRPAQWREVLCLQETRQVGNDNSVRWKGRSLQIPKSPLRPHFARATVRLHEYPDGAVALFWGPHRLADFPPPTANP